MIAVFQKMASAIFLRAELDELTWLIALEKSRLGRRRVKQRRRGSAGATIMPACLTGKSLEQPGRSAQTPSLRGRDRCF
jgi:hypothetical protein